MRKSGFGGLTHFLFFERKVIFMDTGNQFLGTERIGKLMRQYAIPCIISLLVGALYNIVDQIFIANASYLGSYGNAANTAAAGVLRLGRRAVFHAGVGYSDLYHFGHHHRKNLSGIECGRGAERMKSAHPPTKESTPAHRPHHRGAPGGGLGI